MADSKLTPLSINVPVTDPKTGNPTTYFQRMLQILLEEKSVTDDLAETAIQPADLTAALTALQIAIQAVIDALVLDDLADVDTTTTPPTDGQALIWDAANSEWVPGDVASGGGGGGGSLVLLNEQTVSGVSAVNFTNLITSTYKNYIVEFFDVSLSTNAASVVLQYSTNNGSSYDTGANYTYSMHQANQGTFDSSMSNGSNTAFISILHSMSNGGTSRGSGDLKLFNPHGTTSYKHCVYRSFSNSSDGNPYERVAGGQWQNTAAYNAFRLTATAGTFSGTFRLYGIANTIGSVLTDGSVPSKGAFARLSADMSTDAHNTARKVSFASGDVTRNTDGFWSSGQPTRFTIPSGISKVRVYGQIWRSWGTASTCDTKVEIYKNGASYVTSTEQGPTSYHNSLYVDSGVISVNAGDYFEIQGQTYGGAGSASSVIKSQATFFGLEVVEALATVPDARKMLSDKATSAATMAAPVAIYYVSKEGVASFGTTAGSANNLSVTFTLSAPTEVSFMFSALYDRTATTNFCRFTITNGSGATLYPRSGLASAGLTSIYGRWQGEGTGHTVTFSGTISLAAGTHTLQVTVAHALATPVTTFYDRDLQVWIPT